MHQTGMFQPPQQQAQVQVYDLNQIQQQFAGWNFNVGQPYDQYTPQIALMTIREIQGHALKGHPIRVGMFNIISENAFDNQSFQDLVYTIIMRVGHGITNGEWRNYDQAVQTTIVRAVKCCASYMASQDPEFMATLKQDEQNAVYENAKIWEYLLALAQGQAQWVSFEQMQGSGLSNVNTSTQAALADARNLRGQSAGAFVEGGNFESVVPSRYNNNATGDGGRYGRRAEKIYGKLQGSMQGALTEAGLTDNALQPAYQSRMSRPSATGGKAHMSSAHPQPNPAAAAQAAKFDSDVTDFSRPLENVTLSPTVASPPTPAPAPVKTLFTVQIGQETVEIIRKIKEGGYENWKPSRLQRFHPAWCTRTHTVAYFETRDGFVLAVLHELNKEQKEIAMEYDAHAIDPSKGQPEPTVPKKPVRAQARVLYGKAEDVKINLTVAQKMDMQEDVVGAIRSARLAAEMSEEVPDAYAKMSVVNAPIVYSTAADAAEDLIIIRAIGTSKSFAEAAEYLPKVQNDMARSTLNRTLTKAVNRALECELGVGVHIDDFVNDSPELIDFLAGNAKIGTLIAEKLRAQQTAILSANVRVIEASEQQGYADATLAPENEDHLSEEMTKRVLFLQYNVCAVWVNFTDNELAIGMPPKGATAIQPESLGALYKIAQSVYKDAIGGLACSEQYLVTKDSVSYNLHRGMINRECYLLSKHVK